MEGTERAPTSPNPAPHGQWHYCPRCRTPQNYEPNPVEWSEGAVVIHDKDAKKERLLLRVEKVLNSHDRLVRYLNIPREELPFEVRKPFLACLCSLHDPARWGIGTEAAEQKTEMPA